MDKYIGELLFQYDCVIVPDFGGFVTNYAAARIHPTQHTFYPPSKNIVFNKNLKNNDGLLANHISNTENSDFLKANESIKVFVDACNKKLKNKEKVIIKNVGVLHLDVEGNIQFEPERTENYLIESFGFTSFQSPAIKRENYSAKIEKQFKDRMPLPSQRKSIKLRKLVTVASMIVTVFTIAWIFSQTDIVKNINYSNLNPFEKAITPEYKAREASPTTPTTEELIDNTNTTHNFIADDTSKAIATISLSNESSELISVRLKEEQKEKPVLSETTGSNTPYHIIGGCFKILENAKKYISQLQDKNISASIIGQNNAGLYIVSYGDFHERNDAVKELTQIQSSFNADAWLLKKN